MGCWVPYVSTLGMLRSAEMKKEKEWRGKKRGEGAEGMRRKGKGKEERRGMSKHRSKRTKGREGKVKEEQHRKERRCR